MSAQDKRWDHGAYLRIRDVSYDRTERALVVTFADGDAVRVPVKRFRAVAVREARWDEASVAEGSAVHVPVALGTGDLGTDATDISGFSIRALTDDDFAAHLAARAEESARSIGADLRALRQARGFTAAAVGKRAGMDQRSISRIENGQHGISFTTLEKILAAMGYELGDLLPLHRKRSDEIHAVS